jgi:PAS domain S-box-containing protein
MDWQYPVFAIVVIMSALISGVLAAYAWQHRHAARAVPFLVAAALSGWVSLTEALCLFSSTPEAAQVWFDARYLGLAGLPVAWLAFVLAFTDRAAWLTRRRLAGLLGVPALTQLVIWTNPAHQWWTIHPVGFVSIPPFMIADLSVRVPGAWFWFYLAVSYTVFLASLILLVQTIRTRPAPYQRQARQILAGVIAGMVVEILPLFPISSVLKVNPTTPGLALVNLLMAWAVFRSQFLDLSPVARDTLIDRMDDGLLVLDAQSRVVDLNPAMRAWLQQGYVAAERELPAQLVGRLAVDVLSPWPDLVELCQRTGNLQDEFSLNLRGLTRYFDFRMSLMTDQQLRPVGRWIMLRDITSRKRAEIELQKLSRAVHYSPISFVITDVTGAIEYVNLKFSDITGYTFYEAMGQNPRILKSGQTPLEVYQDLWATILSGREWSGEFVNRKKNGDIYWENAVIAPIMTDLGEITHFAAVKEDITKRKQAEDALRRYTAELEASNAELDAFAHTVAHDLNNPLSVILGFGELLEENFEALTRKDISDSLARMAQTGRKMSRIIKELLLLASVRKMDEVNISVLDMHAVVAETLERSADLAASAGAQIVVPDTWPAAAGYGPWVEEIWSNYVGNAIKYGGTPPRIELGADRTGDQVRFWVRDNGAGLTADQQSRLFTEFARLHSTRAQGYGLGLSIVKRIADKLGGRVGVESEVGHGSLFYFTLPASVSAQAAVPGADSSLGFAPRTAL